MPHATAANATRRKREGDDGCRALTLLEAPNSPAKSPRPAIRSRATSLRPHTCGSLSCSALLHNVEGSATTRSSPLARTTATIAGAQIAHECQWSLLHCIRADRRINEWSFQCEFSPITRSMSLIPMCTTCMTTARVGSRSPPGTRGRVRTGGRSALTAATCDRGRREGCRVAAFTAVSAHLFFAPDRPKG